MKNKSKENKNEKENKKKQSLLSMILTIATSFQNSGFCSPLDLSD